MTVEQIKLHPHPIFQNVFPKTESEELEQDILENGILRPIDYCIFDNKAYILDGYSRLSICEKHGIEEYPTTQRHFKTIEEAELWIRRNQSGRRNLTSEQESYNRGRMAELRAEIGKEQRKGNLRHQGVKHNLGELEIDAEKGEVVEKATVAFSSGSTQSRQKVAEETGVSERTVQNDIKFKKSVDKIEAAVGTEIKNKILNSDIGASKSDIVKIADKTEDEIIELFQPIKKGKVSTIKESIKSIRNKEPEKLSELEIDFAYSYAQTLDSLESLQQVKKKVHKVQASMLRCNADQWNQIIGYWLKGECLDGDRHEYKKTIVSKVNDFKDRFKKTWHDFYYDYVKTDYKENNIASIINGLVMLYDLFDLIDVPRLQTDVQNTIRGLTNRLDALCRVNSAIWDKEKSKVSNQAEKILELNIKLGPNN